MAVVFVRQSLTAERTITAIFDGKPKSGDAYLAAGDNAVAAFPIDRHLHNIRAWIRQQVDEKSASESVQ